MKELAKRFIDKGCATSAVPQFINTKAFWKHKIQGAAVGSLLRYFVLIAFAAK